MRYFLTSVHSLPMFYNVDGDLVSVDLDYVESKAISYIDEFGVLLHRDVGGKPPVVDGIWLVRSVEDSLKILSENGIYPYKNKLAARENAKRLGLKSFKYIAVP